MPASFVYGQVALDFAVEGRKAKAVVRYRYLAQEKTVEYLSIEYSDPKLKEKVEGDPAMRQKINEYVQMMLSKRDHRLS